MEGAVVFERGLGSADGLRGGLDAGRVGPGGEGAVVRAGQVFGAEPSLQAGDGAGRERAVGLAPHERRGEALELCDHHW